MSELFVRNSLNSKKVAKFNLDLKEVVPKNNKGESLWLIEVGTKHLSSTGVSIPPVYINQVADNTVEYEIEKAVSSMCELIDWTQFEEDKYPPIISSFSPYGNNVPIKSKVIATIIDELPSSGLDLSNMSIMLDNGEVLFDITSEVEVTGDPYEYKLTWLPPNING